MTGRRRGGGPAIAGMALVAAGVALILAPTLMVPAVHAMTSPPSDPALSHAAADGTDAATLSAARAYDRQLLETGSDAVGEAPADPLQGGGPAHAADATYQAQLGAGDDMARILIPSISVDLPVGHGSSPALLESQAGHVYGTTLPVGDEGNSVIAAHRGLGLRPLFRRLGELEPDDMVYVRAAGATVAWRVESTWMVDPGSDGERRAVAVERGASLLTLYTCDPPGMNTRRLIVRARRATERDGGPTPTEELTADPARTSATGAATAALIAAAALLPAALRRGARHHHGRRRGRMRRARRRGTAWRRTGHGPCGPHGPHEPHEPANPTNDMN